METAAYKYQAVHGDFFVLREAEYIKHTLFCYLFYLHWDIKELFAGAQAEFKLCPVQIKL